MLDGLDSISWHDLTHAYGRAGDVPELLRDLASAEHKRVSDAIYELYGNIYHQGTVYEATAHAVPFLAELARRRETLHRDQIVGLLHAVATSSEYGDWESGRGRNRRRAGASEHGVAAHEAVRRELPTVIALLDTDEPAEARGAAARTAGDFDEDADSLTPLLCERLRAERDPRVRAAMLVSLGTLGNPAPDAVALLEAAAAAGGGPGEPRVDGDRGRGSGSGGGGGGGGGGGSGGSGSGDLDPQPLFAAISLARLVGEAMSATACNLLVTSLLDERRLERACRELAWDAIGEDHPMDAFALLGPAAARRALPRLAAALEGCDDAVTASYLVDWLLELFFPQVAADDQDVRTITPVTRLSPEQRLAIGAIADADVAWDKANLFVMSLTIRGLPKERKALRRLAGNT